VSEVSPDVGVTESQPALSPSELFEKYRSLAKTVAGRIVVGLPPHVDIDEIHQLCLIGLWEGCNSYQASGKGNCKFESWVRVRMRGTVLDALRENDIIPRSIRDKQKVLKKAMLKLSLEQGREVTAQEALSEAGLTAGDLLDLHFASHMEHPMSIEGRRFGQTDDDNDEILDVPEPRPEEEIGEGLDRERARSSLMQALEELSPTEQSIMVGYYWSDIKLATLGVAMEVSEARICQRHGDILSKLRKTLEKML
jgi:RNA polymerase sigma factor FliA